MQMESAQKVEKPVRPCLLNMTLKFSGVLEVVKVYVRAKFHRAEFSSSWVIVLTGEERKKT